MRKIIRVIYSVLLMFVVIVIVLLIKRTKNNQNNDYTIETTKKFREFENHNELAYWVAIKNGDWSDLPLTDVFRKKYNEKDGIFGDMQFDKVEFRPYNDGKYPFEDYSYLVVTQGKKKTAYTYSLDPDSGDGYNDVIIGSIYPLTDENGNEVDFREGITEKNFTSQMSNLAWGNEDEQLVAVTNSFHKKYPFFLDIFEHYSPLRFNHIEFVPERSSWDRKEAYFIVDSILECKKRYYKVKFTLDDKGYLDDVKAIKVNEEEYDGDGQERINKITYQNSNWDNLKLTDNFRSKYDNKIGIMDDIENINIDIDVDEITLEVNRKYITCFTSKNDEIVSYYFEYIKDKDGNLDNVVCKKLPYINKTASEAKELYLKEHNIQQ